MWTRGSNLSDGDNPDTWCRGSAALTRHDPPLLYNVDMDPGTRSCHIVTKTNQTFNRVKPRNLEFGMSLVGLIRFFLLLSTCSDLGHLPDSRVRVSGDMKLLS